MKTRARITKTNRFVEVTTRREPMVNNNWLYEAPAYTHVGRDTVSGKLLETYQGNYVFIPTGKNKNLI